ncbi:hypothetical protein Arth_4427 (plasmid) [Arthrobacter sp. FB24]|uniref:hypothetical protein n=1 Tax=Arthrobacter sp. (strain FB24) TaxID=290399 RepID=UPI000052753A|nr:hypothetical protein [Arthrobacter sp. FB24]ABK05597.1 hypothetical protein Arth_4427 [Arthrobacter sp. FB24]
MTPQRFRHVLLILAAAVAALSLASVGAVMAMAFNNTVSPAWITSAALYGLPVAFLLMLALVIDAVAARRRTR